MFKEDPHRINEKITAHEIRLVGDNVEIGVYALNKALNIFLNRISLSSNSKN